jgi:DNA-binding MurR/RpiR family transcriptional regulator
MSVMLLAILSVTVTLKLGKLSAAKLGELCGVSESTVVRFAIELGYNGYPEMQKAVQELVRTKLTPNQRIEVTNLRYGDGDLLDNILYADINKIKYTLENINREAFHSAVDDLLGAKNIYIVGVRSSASLASFLHFNLSLIFDNVKFVQPTSSSEVFEQLLNVGKGDVVIAISFPRYSTKIVNAVRYANQCGASVIALTDSTLSPIANEATYLLTAQSDMASFVDSLVAPLSIINALLVAITKKEEERVKERFERLENVWDEYNVYAKQ